MLLTIISAILLILAFPNFNQSYFVFIGFVPLLFAIQKKSAKKAFWNSYLCGFLFYLGVLYWLYHVTGVGLIILCLYLALYFGIFGFLFNRATYYTSGFSLLFIPLIWIFLEYVQSHLFSGFGWALLGYSQYKKLHLIQIADFAGVYGVSFLVMMVNVAVYKFFKRSAKHLVISALVLAMVFWYGKMRENEGEWGDGLKVSVIQGNIPQEIKWDPFASDEIMKSYFNLTRLAAFDEPDLIIWPETSFPGFFISDEEKTKQVLDLARKIQIPLLIGANTVDGLDILNSAVLISKKGEVIDKYDKLHLVPFGEFVPFGDKIPFLHRLVLGELGHFTAGEEYRIFKIEYPSPQKIFDFSTGEQQAANIEHRFATLICFEDIFPGIAKRFVQKGAQFLVVITNDAWYGKSGAPYQHTACSVFRAIENRVPIVRCANTGFSCFIDPYGRIHDPIEDIFTSKHKTSTVKLR
ncbi:MAG: apolipoprotein N-acyltransferase [Candidatus Gorgyraea atricola]|nr:apolipoprotein N-acyltransferase [Candidatus Gorgyraea atricola]